MVRKPFGGDTYNRTLILLMSDHKYNGPIEMLILRGIILSKFSLQQLYEA